MKTPTCSLISGLVFNCFAGEVSVEPAILSDTGPSTASISNSSSLALKLDSAVLSGDLFQHRFLELSISIDDQMELVRNKTEYPKENRADPSNPDPWRYKFSQVGDKQLTLNAGDSMSLKVSKFDLCPSCGMYLGEAIFAVDLYFGNQVVTTILRHKDPMPRTSNLVFLKEGVAAKKMGEASHHDALGRKKNKADAVPGFPIKPR